MTKSIVCWLWDDGSQRSKSFEPVHVNVLQRMVARHLQEPHRFICITDAPADLFAPGVEVLPMPAAAKRLAEIRTPEGPKFPSCYQRLWMFSPEATVLGERVLLIDIDLVVVADLAPIFDQPSEFVGWRPIRDWGRPMRFGGGIYLITPGARPEVWNEFDGAPAIARARAAGFRGSDQAWISFMLGHRDPHWGRDSGIYSIRDMAGKEHKVPKDARLVQFNGPTKPWQSPLPWVREHWR